MFSIQMPAEPRWLDLPHGVRVEVRPADGLVRAAAEAAVLRAVKAHEDDRAERIEVGAGVADMLDLEDEDLRRTFVGLSLAAKLARYGILRWEGVEEEHTPERAERMMLLHHDMANAFLAAYLEPAAAVAAEGNASGAASSGSSAAAPTIAPDASPDAETAQAT